MTKLRKDNYDLTLFKTLKIDCSKCFGICCVALYFSKSDGFPKDKVAGEPCVNLKDNFTCKVHKDLKKKGLKGCTTYDCFGAGQKVVQITYKGENWIKSPELAYEMYDSFIIMRKLHEMLWYLSDALTFKLDSNTEDKLIKMIEETEKLTILDAKSLKEIDIENHQYRVNSILKEVANLIREKAIKDKSNKLKNKKCFKEKFDLIGADLTKYDLSGAKLSGTLLIAANMRESSLNGANFIGSDMRDMDIRGANLEDSLFVTQHQINSARGDLKTKLPPFLLKPSYW